MNYHHFVGDWFFTDTVFFDLNCFNFVEMSVTKIPPIDVWSIIF